MIKLLFLILFSPSVFALEAVITVLEAPIFESPNLDAKVVHYFRKGDVIKLHPSFNVTRQYDHLAPSLEKQKNVAKEISEKYQDTDPLFKGEQKLSPDLDDEFIPLISREGKDVYVLREHIYVYLETPQEFNQKTVKQDPTDYRLEEPLPKKYPLKTFSGVRGQVLLGLTQPYSENYPYRQSVISKGYSSPIDLNITLLKSAEENSNDRFFFGGTLSLRKFKNEFILKDFRSSEEEGTRVGIGPYICYDTYKGKRQRLNLYGAILVNLFNQINVIQHSSEIAEERNYRAINLATRIGVQYHLKSIAENVDFVASTGLELEPQTTYKAINAGSNTSYWRHTGEDQFTTKNLISLGGYLGIQAAY